jgi:geranylgeranyl diphosphate synthase type II
MGHPFLQVLAEARTPVYKRMMSYIGGEVPGVAAQRVQAVEDHHWAICRDYPERGGKFVRPTLLLLTAEALGTPREEAIQTAAALEISQNWLLIHDDVEDASLLRRGKPALQHIYGDAMAINAGDALHLLMWRILRENGPILGPARTLRVMAEFDRMLLRTCVGQTAELMWQKRLDFTEGDYFYIIDGKTSYYTIAGGMRLGAIIAEEDEQRLQADILPALDAFGLALGRAFQIIDDVLDVSTEDDGKQRGGDIAEGKITLILAHLLSEANAADRETITGVMELPRDAITQADVDVIIGLMEQYGSIAYARGRAEALAQEALTLFDAIDFFQPGAAYDGIRHGIDFIVRRGS